jgi:phage terminase large subunit-like protein
VPCFINGLKSGQRSSYFGMNASRHPTHHKMSETSKYEKKRKRADAIKKWWSLLGSTILFQPAPSRFLHGSWYSISQSAYLLVVHKSSSQLYHSVRTTYYSTDTDCRKQYLVLLFDPGSGAGSAGSSWKFIQFVVKNYLIYLEKRDAFPSSTMTLTS